MRRPRLKPEGQANVFHCISLLVSDQYRLQPPEREQFRRLMWRLADFCQMQLITHTILSTHFHIVVRSPAQVALSDEALVVVLEDFYGADSAPVKAFQEALRRQAKAMAAEQEGAVREAEEALRHLREKYHQRMGDVSVFMKEPRQSDG